jgi:acyl carrier protein
MTAPALDPADVRDKLRRFILAELLRQPAFPLQDDEPLMSGGLIDSFCVAHLGVFIEKEFDVYIPDVDLTVENMDTLRRIGEQVLSRSS